MSPVVVRCSECGYILGKEDVELVDLKVLVKDLNGKCPKCGHLLTLPPKTVEVKPYPTRFGEKAAGSSHQDSSQGGYADFPHSQQKNSGSRTSLWVLPPPAL